MAERKRSSKRRSPKRKSPKQSYKRKTSRRKSPKRKSSKRKSPKRKSPKRKSSKRKSPKTPAVAASTLFEGTRRKGRDGHMYIVRLKADGSPYWKKCGPKSEGGSECRFVGPMRKPAGY